MSDWQAAIASLIKTTDANLDMLRFRLRELFGERRPIMIAAYRGFGTQHQLYLKGRVLEDKGIGAAGEDDSRWDNLVNMYKRFVSSEVPHARLVARHQGVEYEVQADGEGYFDLWVEPKQPLPIGRLWHEIELELVSPRRKGMRPVKTIGNVLVPPESSRFAVISDIDDTVLHTDAVSMLRMARTVLFSNARTRLPFKGAAAFYRALFCGQDQKNFNPLFYVSNSPWNLYDLLGEFFHLNDIPIGPVLFLRNWGFTHKEQFPMRRRPHKLTIARNMLTHFPHLPFILIGDSGEEDPEIYAELVDAFPNRIRAVYIRNVSRDLRRSAEVRTLADRVLKAGSTLILADNTWPMAQHAAEQGWISADALAMIDAERQKDTEPANSLEQLLGEPKPHEPPSMVIKPNRPRTSEEG
jgi:phosphatidate phosphatase APP1